MAKRAIIACAFAALFFLGIMMILKCDSWGWGDYDSMMLAGVIISIFSGTGFLRELYGNKKH